MERPRKGKSFDTSTEWRCNKHIANNPEIPALVNQLKMRYVKSTFNNFTKRHNETLQKFETDIIRLIGAVYPSAPSNFIKQLVVQTFHDVLRDQETQQALHLGRNKILEDALTHALEFEVNKQTSKNQVIVRQLKT